MGVRHVKFNTLLSTKSGLENPAINCRCALPFVAGQPPRVVQSSTPHFRNLVSRSVISRLSVCAHAFASLLSGLRLAATTKAPSVCADSVLIPAHSPTLQSCLGCRVCALWHLSWLQLQLQLPWMPPPTQPVPVSNTIQISVLGCVIAYNSFDLHVSWYPQNVL